MVDCIAYWLWQLEPSLPDWAWLREVPLSIQVTIGSPASWERTDHIESAGPVADSKPANLRTVALTVLPAMATRMDSPDNAAERDLIASVLGAISDLAEQHGETGLSKQQLATALDVHAPLGPKKKINVFSSGKSPALRDGNLPRARLRQDADSSDALDEMSAILLPELGHPVGKLPDDVRVKTLNRAVDEHYQALIHTVATLSPDGLLEDLVAHHEALLRRDELQRRTLGSRMACFQETTLIEDLIREVPEVTTSSVALRFLIEHVAACPPAGFRPMSLGIYDRLIAHASEIVNRGMVSDVIKNDLDDLEVSVLASGRLGMSQDGRYRTGQQAFLNASIPVVARDTAASYASFWDVRSTERPAIADRLDSAAKAEFGFTMSALGAFFAELVNAAERRDHRVAVDRRDVLIPELASALGWRHEAVARALELLSLGPREDFLKPPAPFRPADVYPWHFNRRLSYLRKPVLLREAQDGVEVVWAMRHVWLAGQYLANLILSERLDARSLEMKRFMSEVRQQEATTFNEAIADLCREQGMVVRTQVQRIGALSLTRTRNGRQEAIGDIDVLAADAQLRTLFVLECKNLEGARTPSELKNEIDRTFAVGQAKRSKLEIHLERIAWARSHIAEIVTWMRLSDLADGWAVDGRMVTDIEVLAPHVVRECPIPVVSAASLREELGLRRRSE